MKEFKLNRNNIGVKPAVSDEAAEKFIRGVLEKMTTEEKIRLTYGRASLSIGKLEQYGIREVFVADGPQGIRREDGGLNTALPCGLALAASFDTALAEQYGGVIGEEARACGIRGSLGPGLNLTRTPLNGRTFEYYGEDPVVAGKIAAGYVRGCQSKKVAATPKHMALNNQEICRTTGDSRCDKAVLRGLYLEGFEIVCRESQPWMVMSSYNKINGEQASACNYTQREFLKEECGFDGVVVSDWGGTWDAKESLLYGQDLEMGGGEHTHCANELPGLMEKGELPMEVLDEAALRNLRLLYRMGAFEKTEDDGGFVCNSPEHQEFVRKAACECAVLLKNEKRHLPETFGKCKKIAVIGPSADYRHCIGSLLLCGGSGAVHAPYEITVLEAAQTRWGKDCEITYAPGVHFEFERLISSDYVPEGFTAEYFESKEDMAEGKEPFLRRCEERVDLHAGVLNAGGAEDKADPRLDGLFAVKYSGKVIPRQSGKAAVKLALARFRAKLFVNGEEIKFKDGETADSTGSPLFEFEAVAGKAIDIRIEAFRQNLETADLRLLYFEDENSDIRKAAALAAEADQVIYVGGTHHGYDKEAIGHGNVAGADIPDLQLPSNQDKLISELAKVNSNITVVLINGTVVNTSAWIDKVPAVVEMFYPGMECGNSVLDILEGKATPNGRLPFTWSDDLQDYPSIANGNYPGTVDAEIPTVHYDEGVFIGYRYFDREKLSPRFPFGYGLSYAEFEHELLGMEQLSDDKLAVRIKVKNTSSIAGASVIQLYVGREDNLPERPEKVLRNFAKVHLSAGEEKTAVIELSARDFSYCDPDSFAITYLPGKYTLSLGTDSRNIFASREILID